MMLRNIHAMSESERTRYAVALTLSEKHGVAFEEAERMANESAFSGMLEETPALARHRSAEYWAAQILDEYGLK